MWSDQRTKDFCNKKRDFASGKRTARNGRILKFLEKTSCTAALLNSSLTSLRHQKLSTEKRRCDSSRYVLTKALVVCTRQRLARLMVSDLPTFLPPEQKGSLIYPKTWHT